MVEKQSSNNTQANSPIQINQKKYAFSKKDRGPRPMLGLKLAIQIPPLGIIVSIWSLIVTIKNHQKGRGIAIVGIVVGILLSVVLYIIISTIFGMYHFSGLWRSNQAQDAIKPIEAKIVQFGGRKLCANGDGGYSFDNAAPWYWSYYSVGKVDNLTQQIKDVVEESGYQVKIDSKKTDRINAVNVVYAPSLINESISGMNQKTRSSISVEVVRSGHVDLNCIGRYGEPVSPESTGGAIVSVHASFPSTR